MNNRLHIATIALGSVVLLGHANLSPVSPVRLSAAGRTAARATAGVAAPRSLHSVTGSGKIEVFPGFSFTTTLAANVDEDSNAFGTMTGRSLDMSAYGLSGLVTMVDEVRCMRVVGNTAWIGLRLSHITNPLFGAPGDLGVAWVVDLGGPGEDIAYSGPAWFLDPLDQICSDTPPDMPQTLARPGNFTVR